MERILILVLVGSFVFIVLSYMRSQYNYEKEKNSDLECASRAMLSCVQLITEKTEMNQDIRIDLKYLMKRFQYLFLRSEEERSKARKSEVERFKRDAEILYEKLQKTN